jgi:hypothetical protein
LVRRPEAESFLASRWAWEVKSTWYIYQRGPVDSFFTGVRKPFRIDALIPGMDKR